MKDYRKYAFIGILLALLVISFFIVKPFINAIFASFILAYVFYPLYRRIKRIVRFPSLAAFIVSFLILMLVALPLFFITNAIVIEIRENYSSIKSAFDTNSTEFCTSKGMVCNFFNLIKQNIANPTVSRHIANLASRISDTFVRMANAFIISIPHYILNFFIMLFMLFFLLKEGELLLLKVKHILPFKDKHTKDILDQIKEVTHAVIYGHILVSAGQAVLGGIAFWIFGVSSPVFWGFVMFFFALIPFLGTPIIWLPAVIIKIIGNEPVQAIGILISGIIISTIDNLIKPKIISDNADVHPVLVLLGVLGGISLFGFIGIIIGPLLLAVFVKLIDIYEEEQSEAKS
jgi:predicted PurR-regulated permease PerM